MNYRHILVVLAALYGTFCLSSSALAELTPLLVPTLDSTTNKYVGKSVITDSIDNRAPGQQFRDRTYYYDLALDSSGRAYVLYAQPKPLALNSSQAVDFDHEKTDIILAVETATGWSKQTLTTEGVFQPSGLQIEVDKNDVLHLIYIRKLTKTFSKTAQEVDYLIYRKVENGVVSEEVEVGDTSLQPPNFSGLGGWRTRMAIAPDNSVYMIREGGNDNLGLPLLKLLTPDGKGNWTAQAISGLPATNWYRIGKFLIDSAGKAHIIFVDYAYNSAAQTYTAGGFFGLDNLGFHNLWYASSATLDARDWKAVQLDEDPKSSAPALNNFQFWPDLALDERNNPAVATWLWRVDTQFPGYNSSTVFLQPDAAGNWVGNRTTRIFDDVTYRPNGPLAGMGAGLIKDAAGWHGVWDSSHPRPFEHAFERGGVMYRFSPDGQDWAYYQPVAEFSAEGFCIVKIDKQNRVNILVLGDHTDTQLYLLRYQLPNNNLMEVFADRRYYYSGESVTMKARVQPGAVGDFYVAAMSKERPKIKQAAEIWQLTANLTWQKIKGLDQLRPLLSLPAGAGVDFNNTIGVVGPGQAPFDKQDTDYTIYSVVAEPGTNVLDGQWVTPLFAREISVNKSLPQ